MQCERAMSLVLGCNKDGIQSSSLAKVSQNLYWCNMGLWEQHVHQQVHFLQLCFKILSIIPERRKKIVQILLKQWQNLIFSRYVEYHEKIFTQTTHGSIENSLGHLNISIQSRAILVISEEFCLLVKNQRLHSSDFFRWKTSICTTAISLVENLSNNHYSQSSKLWLILGFCK